MISLLIKNILLDSWFGGLFVCRSFFGFGGIGDIF